MPHLICECSSDHAAASIQDLLSELHVAASSTGIVRAEDLKIRCRAYNEYLFAGRKQSFFHLQFYLNAGRTTEQKKLLSTAALKVLTTRFPKTVHISVDMREMDRLGNSKRVLA